MLHSADISLDESALLVVDAQDSFRLSPRWGSRSNRDFETNVASLIGAYRKAGLPVFYFLHADGDPGFELGDPHYRLMDFIRLRKGEIVLHKNTRNCFTSTTLQPLLLEKRVRRLAITGIQMEQCCETSARVAADLGYAVDFVMDAMMTFPIPSATRPGEYLGVEAIEERTRYALEGRFARIVTTQNLVEELRALCAVMAF
jgi:nicotinamidase-related amidase